ncbi:cilia- and flagella-associated protein 100-like [Pectinophora gossypiella]|uniref:cilia- and flagella-associated protein 100-like n=1 Tax=Pectinophora gossypiella TaxID=13191 RepID=UPI00214E2250|nr:cilia- and flagella-associated protein 100-like [Pectinophora gossypiella]
MESAVKKTVKKETKKVVPGVKLPPIEPVPDDDVRTILEIDPDFYSLIQGRPIRQNKSISKYKQDIKDLALKRTLHGYLVDEIIRIEREIETERNVYETAYKHFEECQHSFDKFLAYDNDKTIIIMKKSDNFAKNLANEIEEHKKISYELASIKSKLQYIDETLLILLSFENFLHKAAPILWQESNNVKLDTKHTEIITKESDIFSKVDVNFVKERLSELAVPRLYFETPNQLLTIFDLLEKQNLNYLLVTEELNSEKNKFLKTKDALKTLLYQELEQIQKKIQEIEEIITWNEDREAEVKEVFFRILGEKIKYIVSSQLALELLNYVEYAYELLITPNDTKLGTLEMTLALEGEYNNLMLGLSVFDLDMVKQIEKEIYEEGDLQIKQAKAAHKLLEDVNKLNRRLKSSYEPSRRKKSDY